uniref:Uncharacterized protein n=1 Tax=Trypanosoma congolense (strain IL3000) TaxID=1068625 RepID=G0V2L9_TRYCI|nr:hypothetical protein, unlikely [Trypanosoma congolense IL3000]
MKINNMVGVITKWVFPDSLLVSFLIFCIHVGFCAFPGHVGAGLFTQGSTRGGCVPCQTFLSRYWHVMWAQHFHQFHPSRCFTPEAVSRAMCAGCHWSPSTRFELAPLATL